MGSLLLNFHRTTVILKLIIRKLLYEIIFDDIYHPPNYFPSTISKRMISGLLPTRIGGPQVPKPLET